MNKQRVKRAERKANITKDKMPLVLWDRDPTDEEQEKYNVIRVTWDAAKEKEV